MNDSRYRHGQEGGYHQAKARALTVSSGMSREHRGGNGASALQDVRTEPSFLWRKYQRFQEEVQHSRNVISNMHAFLYW